MNEKEFGGKVARLLESSLKQIDAATSAKLKNARLTALSRHREKAAAHGLVWAGGLGGRFGELFTPRSFFWAPFVAVLLALGITGYWQYQHEGDDVDAWLLAGDLPIQAYIDQDFDAWLKGYSR